MKHKEPHLGFELRLPVPLFTVITIMLSKPPYTKECKLSYIETGDKILSFLFSSCIIKSYWQYGVPRLSLTICPYHPSLLASLPGSILCLHRAGVSPFWSANAGTSMCRSPKENPLMFVFASPAMPIMSCSSYLNGL